MMTVICKYTENTYHSETYHSPLPSNLRYSLLLSVTVLAASNNDPCDTQAERKATEQKKTLILFLSFTFSFSSATEVPKPFTLPEVPPIVTIILDWFKIAFQIALKIPQEDMCANLINLHICLS